MPKSELSPLSNSAINTLGLLTHDLDFMHHRDVWAWAQDLPEDHRGLMSTGKANIVKIVNAFSGMDPEDLGTTKMLDHMGQRHRSFVEAVLKFSKPHHSVMVRLRACPSPFPKTTGGGESFPRPIIRLSCNFGFDDLVEPPSSGSDLLEMVANPECIGDAGFHRGDPACLELAYQDDLKAACRVDPSESLSFIRRVLISSGEVDWHNLDISENS